MSDNWILIVPKLPAHVPSANEANAAIALLKKSMPNADEIEIIQNEYVEFFDCGANFETVTCPRCCANIDIGWWGETMSSDYDEKLGFQLNECRLPCCSTPTSLDELIYRFHQAFGRFALSAMNPNVGKVSDYLRCKIEATLGCDVSIVYQHI